MVRVAGVGPWRIIATAGRPVRWLTAYFPTRSLARAWLDWLRSRGWYGGVDRVD